MDLISVVIPVYNVEKYLEECLTSIVKQTYSNLEIILIDDGSTDNSSVICKKFAAQDKRIVYHKQKNKGLSGARNKGMALSKGKYIGFVDSDDYIALNFYEELYKAIKENNVQIACSSIHQFKKNKISLFLQHSDDIIHISPENIAKLRYSVWHNLYDINLIKDQNVTFIEGICFEDIPFSWPLILSAQQIAVTSKTYYVYRRDNFSSITRKKSDKHNDLIYAYDCVKEYLKQNNYWDDYKYSWFYVFFPTAFTHVRRVMNKELFLHNLIESIKEDDFSNSPLSMEPLIQKYYQAIQDGYTASELLKLIKREKTKRKIFTCFGLFNRKQRKNRNVTTN